MQRRRLITAAALAGTLALVPLATAYASSATMLDSFTQNELDDNWEADRQFPSGGVTSVSAFGRDNVAQLTVDSAATEANTFRRTEGIKTSPAAQNFGDAVQVDLYVDEDWQDTAMRAGLWVVGDDGAGARDNWFGIIELANLEPSDSGASAVGDHLGWRIWDSQNGWTDLDTEVNWGEWATLTITLDPDAGEYSFAIDGDEVGTGPAGRHFLREVFLNSYNYGLDEFPTPSNAGYSAHWHAGLEDVESKDQCKDGAWQDAGFKNQGQCLRYVNTGEDSR